VCKRELPPRLVRRRESVFESVRERERETERQRERERESVCVCARERECVRERDSPPRLVRRRATERAIRRRLYIACAPRRLTRLILELRAVPSGTLLNLRTSAEQKRGAVPRRALV